MTANAKCLRPIVAITETTHAQLCRGRMYVFRGVPCRLRTRYSLRADGVAQMGRYNDRARVWAPNTPVCSPLPAGGQMTTFGVQ